MMATKTPIAFFRLAFAWDCECGKRNVVIGVVHESSAKEVRRGDMTGDRVAAPKKARCRKCKTLHRLRPEE